MGSEFSSAPRSPFDGFEREGYRSFLAGTRGSSKPRMLRCMTTRGFSWLGLFLGPIFFAYRKLYKPALVYFAAMFVLTALDYVLIGWDMLLGLVGLVVSIVFGFAFYPLLRRKADAVIDEAQSREAETAAGIVPEGAVEGAVEGAAGGAAQSVPDTTYVAKRGGTSMKAALAVLAGTVLVNAALFFAFAFAVPPHRMDDDVSRYVEDAFGPSCVLAAVESGEGRYLESVEGQGLPCQWVYRYEAGDGLPFVVRQYGESPSGLSSGFYFEADYPARLAVTRAHAVADGVAQRYPSVSYELAELPADDVLADCEAMTVTVSSVDECEDAIAFAYETVSAAGTVPRLFSGTFSASVLLNGPVMFAYAEVPKILIRSDDGVLLDTVPFGESAKTLDDAALAEAAASLRDAYELNARLREG